jgi:hypothetical protein
VKIAYLIPVIFFLVFVIGALIVKNSIKIRTKGFFNELDGSIGAEIDSKLYEKEEVAMMLVDIFDKAEKENIILSLELTYPLKDRDARLENPLCLKCAGIHNKDVVLKMQIPKHRGEYLLVCPECETRHIYLFSDAE